MIVDELKKRIMDDGVVLPGGIVRVDSFLNHQIDVNLVKGIGREFAHRFADCGVTRVLTVEASGIAAAAFTALELGVPMIFAKKLAGINSEGDRYFAQVNSYTKRTNYSISVSKSYLSSSDNVLIIDDFLAAGEAAAGLKSLIDQAGARLAGIGIIIEKGFQDGGKQIRNMGIRLESLAVVKNTENDRIVLE